MKFTDIFVHRPVVATVVSLLILIAGLQSIRSLSVRQYPRSDIAVVTVTTVYVGANADLVRGFVTTPLERVIASADGIDYMESSSAQGLSTITVHLKLNYDTNAALTQIQSKVAQVRNDLPPEAEAPDHRPGDWRQPVRRDVPRLLVDGSRPEPDHRLPHPRGPAEADRDQRRAARRHPRRRTFAMRMNGLFTFADTDLKFDQPQVLGWSFAPRQAEGAGRGPQPGRQGPSNVLGGDFVNRFNIQGRSYKVIPQIKRADRLTPEQLRQVTSRARTTSSCRCPPSPR